MSIDTIGLREGMTADEWSELVRDVQLCRVSWPFAVEYVPSEDGDDS